MVAYWSSDSPYLSYMPTSVNGKLDKSSSSIVRQLLINALIVQGYWEERLVCRLSMELSGSG